MRRIFFISLLAVCGAALLWPSVHANTTPSQRSLRNVLGPLRVAQEGPAPAVPRVEENESAEEEQDVDVDRDEPDMKIKLEPPEIEIPDIHVDVDIPDVHVDVNPEIDSDSEIDVDREEPEMDVDTEAPDIDVDIDSDEDSSFKVHEQEKLEKSFTMPAGHRSLEIDNIWGSIEVTGGPGDQVQLTVNKTLRAESKEQLEKARKDVTLDITQQGDLLKLYVNGPFRCQCNDCRGSRGDEGYNVKMDFQVRVPRDIDLKVKTVNEGRVIIREVNGNFLVRNVNGDIEMDRVAGSGTAHTVNGPVKVSFQQNPRESSDFRTVNGNIELSFARNLAADFRFKTFNGGIYSDFPVTGLPVHGIQEEHHGAKVIFRADRFSGARVSSGGPEIKVENLNGDIRILESHE
jgi:hypothetical protein